jgi:hypothetical protein
VSVAWGAAVVVTVTTEALPTAPPLEGLQAERPWTASSTKISQDGHRYERRTLRGAAVTAS